MPPNGNRPEATKTAACRSFLVVECVQLWCDQAGGRVFIVADEEDAQEAIRRFAQFNHQDIRDDDDGKPQPQRQVCKRCGELAMTMGVRLFSRM